VPMAASHQWPLDEHEFDQLRNAPVTGASVPVEA
jgi:hypothetical protein